MPISITALVFQEEGLWIAQCLEYDIVSFAETLEDLRRQLVGQLEAVVVLDKEEGRVPFEGFKRAPEKYWRMYEAPSVCDVPAHWCLKISPAGAAGSSPAA